MAHVSRVEIHGDFTWDFARNPASGLWIGFCEQLGLNADGATFEELQECMNEAITLLFRDLYEEGDLTPFLEEHGWTMSAEESTPPPKDEPRFDVPYEQRRRSIGELAAVAAG
ncbi:MAG: hypothetical protein OXI03_04910 [Chloroflexota bacterium]|nr:hypothetical protein [Chloroflexota bacterium]